MGSRERGRAAEGKEARGPDHEYTRDFPTENCSATHGSSEHS